VTASLRVIRLTQNVFHFAKVGIEAIKLSLQRCLLYQSIESHTTTNSQFTRRAESPREASDLTGEILGLVIPFHEVNNSDGEELCGSHDLEPPQATDLAELDGWWSLTWSRGPAPPLGVCTLIGTGIGKLAHCIFCFPTFRRLAEVRLKESLPVRHRIC
jgi:hypothetical protein